MTTSILLLVSAVHLQDRKYFLLLEEYGPSLPLDAVNLEFLLSYNVSVDVVLVFGTFFKTSKLGA